MAFIAGQLIEGHADNSIRDVDADTAATVVLLTAQSFVFSARLVDIGAMKELRHLLDAYLRQDEQR